MTFSHFLNQVIDTNNKINAKKELLEALRTTSEHCTSSLSPTPHSCGNGKNGSVLENITIQIVRLEGEIEAEVIELTEMRSVLLNFIYSELDDVYERRVIKGIYIDGLSFQELAEEMSYTDRHIYRLRDQALKKLESKYLYNMSPDVVECQRMSVECLR